MRKTHWISLSIALVIAAALGVLEQRRGRHFLEPHPQPLSQRERGAENPLPSGEGGRRPGEADKSLDYKLAFFMQRAELATYDARFKLRGDVQPDPSISIIAIDEKSLASLKQWPWPRGIHARLIRTLRAAPPKALLFDVFFIDPFTSNPEGDRELIQATREAPWVVHSLFYEPSEGPIQRLGLPFPALLKAAGHLGYANAVIDEDGVLRRAVPLRSAEDQTLYFMSVLGASLYLNKPESDVLKNVPVDPRGRLLVHFTGREFTYPYVSYADVLSGKIPASQFAGKIVLVGSTATGTFDHYPTPLSKFMPGVEFHANVIDNLLQLNTLRHPGLRVTYILIAVFGLFCGLILARYSAWAGALWALGACAVYGAAAQWLFVSKHLAIDMAGPLLTLGGGYVAILIYRFFTEEREKRWVKAAFGQYVSSKVLDVLMDDPSKLRLGGERREMSVLFSDVAGFTSISERLDPEDLVVLLNRYLTAMTEVVFEYDGYLNKYMGDGIMAFWNAPVKQVNHAELACRCALKSMERLKNLNLELAKLGPIALKARIGINTGVMVVGNMGSSQKSDYTVMGDNVNLASRLEGANKAFNSSIMISEFTCDSVSDLFEMRFLDIIRVPGKAKPVKTYELLGEKGSVDPVWGQVLPLYHQAIQEFGSQQFESAKRKFLEVLKILGHDKPCETYIQRADAFIAHPPPKDWDGVFELKTK
jgi:adenylate cyclase